MVKILAALFMPFRRPTTPPVMAWEQVVIVRHPIRCTGCGEPLLDGSTVLRRTSGGLDEFIHEFCAGRRGETA